MSKIEIEEILNSAIIGMAKKLNLDYEFKSNNELLSEIQNKDIANFNKLNSFLKIYIKYSNYISEIELIRESNISKRFSKNKYGIGDNKMKKIILNSLLVINLLYGNNIVLDKNIKDKIVMLDNEKEYQTARELLNDFITNDNKMDSLRFWLEQDKKILQNLYFTNDSLTIISYNTQNNNYETAKDIAISNIPFFGLGITAYRAYNSDTAYQKKEKQRRDLENYYISLYDISNTKKILKQFDVLKQSQDKLSHIFKEYIKQANTQEFKNILPLLKEVKNFKNKIKISRTNFISYTVVSPYLANAQRYIILSNSDIIGHNEKYLGKAVRSIAKGAYKDILLESNEDVREQFYTVFQKLKDIAGEKEWEDLKVLQTLMDSSSNDKKTGSDRWWK
jgi:hypothetical protein